MNIASEYLDDVESLNLILTSRATGKGGSDLEYRNLRELLLSIPELADKIPRFVRICHSLDEFWEYIRPKVEGYAPRRAFLQKEFEPLYQYLESGKEDKGPETKVATATTPIVSLASTDDMKPSPTTQSQLDSRQDKTASNSTKNVFVVHGRNEKARLALFQLLRSVHLFPMEWEAMVKLTGKASPYTGDVIDAGLKRAQATIVLFTGDDLAMLRTELQDPSEPEALSPQPRPNVILEAGMALAINRDRTLIVQIGRIRPMSDLNGLHILRLDGSAESRHKLVERLRTIGCDVETVGTDWLKEDDFRSD